MWITFSWPRTSSSLAVKPLAKFVNYVYIYYENCTITYAIRYSVYYDFTRRPANQPTVTALALCLRMLDTPDRCNNSGITCVRSLTAPSVSKPQNRRMRGWLWISECPNCSTGGTETNHGTSYNGRCPGPDSHRNCSQIANRCLTHAAVCWLWIMLNVWYFETA